MKSWAPTPHRQFASLPLSLSPTSEKHKLNESSTRSVGKTFHRRFTKKYRRHFLPSTPICRHDLQWSVAAHVGVFLPLYARRVVPICAFVSINHASLASSCSSRILSILPCGYLPKVVRLWVVRGSELCAPPFISSLFDLWIMVFGTLFRKWISATSVSLLLRGRIPNVYLQDNWRHLFWVSFVVLVF